MDIRTGAAAPRGTPILALLALIAVGATPTPALPQSACPDPEAVTAGTAGALAHVRYLADDALEGRDSGSEGERCAAAYIVARFEETGLSPAGEDGTRYQSFPVRTGTRVSGEMLQTTGSAIDEDAVWTPGIDAWSPFGFSASGER